MCHPYLRVRVVAVAAAGHAVVAVAGDVAAAPSRWATPRVFLYASGSHILPAAAIGAAAGAAPLLQHSMLLPLQCRSFP